MPYDIQLITRYYTWLLGLVPFSVANDFMEHRLQQRMDHDVFGLRPNHRFFQQHPTVNDALANLLASGFIRILASSPS
jgi:dimethylaniline monooxygenase (N-oxide forming)